MDPYADIDLDTEAVWLDGAWLTRQALAARLKQMIEAGDYRVSRLGQALERLEAAVAQAQPLTVRLPPDLAAAVEAEARRLGRTPGQLVREALTSALAAGAPAQPAALPAAQPPRGAPAAAAPPAAAQVAVQARPSAPPPAPAQPRPTATPAPGTTGAFPARPIAPPPKAAPAARPAAPYPDETLDDDPLARDFFGKSR